MNGCGGGGETKQPTQLPANVLGQATADGSSAWTQVEFWLLASNEPNPGCCSCLGAWPGHGRFSVTVSLFQVNTSQKQKYQKTKLLVLRPMTKFSVDP